MVAAVFSTICAQPNADAVSDALSRVRDQFGRMFPEIDPLMDDAEVLALTDFPGRTG